MNNTVLRILQILEEETDSEHALTKAEILQRKTNIRSKYAREEGRIIISGAIV